METTLIEAADRLYSVIRRERCVCWVGSGLSRVSYPGWSSLLDTLCEACGPDPLAGEDRRRPQSLIVKAQECKDANLDQYRDILCKEFADRGPATHRSLIQLLHLPFRAFVTTNFDPLLSNAAADVGRPGFEAFPNLEVAKVGEEDQPIFYLHGHVQRGDCARLVLAKDDFDLAYDAIIPAFLHQLFQSYDVLFLGARLEEPDVRETFDRFRSIRAIQREMGNPNGRERLILYPTRTEEEAHATEIERAYREQGISTVFYPVASEDHRELVEVVTRVRDLESRTEPGDAIGLVGEVAL